MNSGRKKTFWVTLWISPASQTPHSWCRKTNEDLLSKYCSNKRLGNYNSKVGSIGFCWIFFSFFYKGRRQKKDCGPTVSVCENFDPVPLEKWFFDSQNGFHLLVKGLKVAFFMHFLSLPLWAFTHYLQFSFFTRPICHSLI